MSANAELTIGVLALQGDFAAHKLIIERLGVKAILVRDSQELESVDGLILPGGESTTVGKLLDRFGLDRVLIDRANAGMPIYGTCAGLILLASEIVDSDQHRLSLLNATVARNAFGRQIDSFEADIPVKLIGDPPLRAVFIRAPYVVSAGPEVEVLAVYKDKIVAVRQKNILGSAFHPELTGDTRFHELFVSMVREYQSQSQ